MKRGEMERSSRGGARGQELNFGAGSTSGFYFLAQYNIYLSESATQRIQNPVATRIVYSQP